MQFFYFENLFHLKINILLKIPKNKPKGSDLNHPIGLRIKMGNEIENNKAENNPAVVSTNYSN